MYFTRDIYCIHYYLLLCIYIILLYLFLYYIYYFIFAQRINDIALNSHRFQCFFMFFWAISPGKVQWKKSKLGSKWLRTVFVQDKQLYTRILHDFGLKSPPVIHKEDELKEKMSLIFDIDHKTKSQKHHFPTTRSGHLLFNVDLMVEHGE